MPIAGSQQEKSTTERGIVYAAKCICCYWDVYGVAAILSNGEMAILFNDDTRLVVNQKMLIYVDANLYRKSWERTSGVKIPMVLVDKLKLSAFFGSVFEKNDTRVALLHLTDTSYTAIAIEETQPSPTYIASYNPRECKFQLSLSSTPFPNDRFFIFDDSPPEEEQHAGLQWEGDTENGGEDAYSVHPTLLEDDINNVFHDDSVPTTTKLKSIETFTSLTGEILL